jgi:CRISPR/Cas system-associated exonuclease Cas4 (RecB family)
MNIKCMSLKGEFPASECLACAARGDNTCGYDYALLRFIFRDQDPRPSVHVTDITGCLLKAYWQKTRPSVQFPHERIMLALGSITHGLLESSDAVIETEKSLEAFDIVGTTDIYYPERKRVVDTKTTRWLSPSKLPYGSHVLQVNIYAQMLKKMGHEVTSAAIQYIDLSGPTKCRSCKLPVVPVPDGLQCPSCGNQPKDAHLGAVLFEVELGNEADVVTMIEKRSAELKLALEMNQRPSEEPGFLCNYCAYADDCAAGKMQTGRE